MPPKLDVEKNPSKKSSAPQSSSRGEGRSGTGGASAIPGSSRGGSSTAKDATARPKKLASTRSKGDAINETSDGSPGTKKLGSVKEKLDTKAPSSFKPRVKKPPSKPTAELDDADDFDWSTAGGGWTVEKWVESLEIHQTVAAALEVPDDIAGGAYEYCKKLNRDSIATTLRTNSTMLIEALIDKLSEAVEGLGVQAAATGTELSAKFHLDGNNHFEMAFAPLALFFGGLEVVIGPPQLIDGSLEKAMRAEHCEKKDSKRSFTSSNSVTTTSEIEWEFVVEPDMEKEYPDRPAFVARYKLEREQAEKAAAERLGEGSAPAAAPAGAPAGASLLTDEELAALPDMRRKAKTREAFAEDWERMNAALREGRHVELIEVEALAGRLYTGPCYEKYNSALRQHSGVEFMVKKFQDLCKGNAYPTTIHAINSCVLKLSKLTQAVKVWRGFKGATLPSCFFKPNEVGVRGGIEYGFSSTTTDRSQALSYAQGSASTIFEIQQGMVDRGADLSWLSQYPHEREVLFPPLTGVEALNTEVDGSSLLVNTRLSLNMASLTLEQVISRRRKTLMDMTDGMKAEVETELLHAKNEAHAEKACRILLKAVEWGHLSQNPDWFNNDVNFAEAVTQALGVKRGVIRAAPKLPFDTAAVSLRQWNFRHEGRRLLLAGWLCCKPQIVTLDLREIELTFKEAETLAKSVGVCPKLVAINVLHNVSMGEEGAAIFNEALASTPSLRSLCGISPTSNSLEVPKKHLDKVDAMLIASELSATAWTEQMGAAEGKGTASKLVRRTGSGLGQSWHPLIWACKEGNKAIVQALIARGANVNENEEANHESGFTALMWAAYRGHASVVDLLLDEGADPSILNNAGRNAASLAEMKGYKNIAEVCTYVAAQVQAAKSKTLSNVAERALLVRKAASNFKSVGSHASEQVRFEEDMGLAHATTAAVKLQALHRGHSKRNLLKEAVKEVKQLEEASPSLVANLAKQAMYTRVVTARLKQPIMPRSRVGFAEFQRQSRAADVDDDDEEPVQVPAPTAPTPRSLKPAKTTELPTTSSPPMSGEMKSKAKSSSNLKTARDEDASATNIQRIERGRSTRHLLAQQGKPPASGR